jgi:carboxylesterase
MGDFLKQLLDNGDEVMDGIGSDIADPDSHESAYPQTPLRPLMSLLEAAAEFRDRLPRIACPVLIITSRQDHVVPPENSDVLADSVKGPVERVFLDRSFHVATQDYDKAEVEAKVVEFATRVTS